MQEKEIFTEEEINEMIKNKLENKNLLFQEQAVKMMTNEAHGSVKMASYVVRKVCEFAKVHNDSVLSTHTTCEALKQLYEHEQNKRQYIVIKHN